jgi:hypothetical protein
MKNSTGYGKTVLVNAPEPWFVQGDLGDGATPGGWFIVSGTCLERTGGSTPQAVLVSSGAVVANLTLAERVTTSTGYALKYSVPSNITIGDYELYLHNGRGGTAAWVKYTNFVTSEITTVSVKSPISWPTTIINITSQSGANDDTRFTNAIAAITTAGGGIIYFPAGTYTLTKAYTLPDKLIIRGAGKNLSTIQWNLSGTLVRGNLLINQSAASFAIENITLTAGSNFFGTVVARWFTQEYGWFKNIRITASGLDITSPEYFYPAALCVRGSSNTAMEDIELDAMTAFYTLGGANYFRLTNSILHWRNQCIWVSGSNHNFLCLNNTFNTRGDANANGWSAQPNSNPGVSVNTFYAGPIAGAYTRDILWANNISTKDSPNPLPVYVGYTTDGGDGIYAGTIAGASGMTLTLSGATRNDVSYTWTGAIVQILDGTGAGQWRYVLSGATPGSSAITLDRAWDVIPDSSSYIVINNLQGRILMIDNDFAEEPLIQDYFTTIDVIKAGNKLGVSGSTMNMVNWAGHHYTGTFPAWHFQMLGNHITRGNGTSINSSNTTATSGYNGIVGSAHVMRNNTNATSNYLKLYVGSNVNTFADVVIEKNQATNIYLKGASTFQGILINNNKTSSGTASTVSPLNTGSNTLPSGVTVQ